MQQPRFRKWNSFIVFICAIFFSYSALAATTQTVTLSNGGNIENLLNQIARNTFDTADFLNRFIGTWLEQDRSPTSATLAANLTNVSNAIMQNRAVQASLLQRLNADLMGPAVTAKTLPQANDLVYSSLVGLPYFSPDPRNDPAKPNERVDNAYNFIRNASGILTAHEIPGNWSGDPTDQLTYIHYYDSMMAVESFNSFVLTDMYAEALNGGPFTKAQEGLIAQAKDNNWFPTVGSEPLGVVMRQMLMYESETFILLTQLIQIQKQMLAATVMGNTIGILQNGSNEITLRNKAKNPPGSPQQ